MRAATDAATDDAKDDSLPDAADAADGNRVVVAIGIDRYDAWSQLGNAVSDARGTAAALRSLGFTERKPLIDGEATGQAIQKLVIDDLGTLGVNDSLVVFFAGHGGTRTRQLENGTTVKTGYIIPVDAERKDGEVATWIKLESWLAEIAQLPPRHILVILDACHSGIAFDSLRTRGGDSGPAEPSIATRNVEAGPAGGASPLSRRRSRKLIVSALDDEVALDGGPKPGHSLFTGYLIEALTGGAPRDGSPQISGSELAIRLQRCVRSYPRARQTPSIGVFELDDQGELMIPLRPMLGADSARAQLADTDVHAALRARLAATLAGFCGDRAAIARLLSLHAPEIRAAQLPADRAEAIWPAILVELANAHAPCELSALVEAVQQRSRRARRFDWSVFSALIRPAGAPVSWSRVAVEIRRGAPEAGGTDDLLIPDGGPLLEAIVTQRWGGARPRAPRIEVTSHRVFGGNLRLLHQATQLPCTEVATARWLVRIPVPKARLRTRIVTVRCDAARSQDRRYVVPPAGSMCAAILWLACAAFAAIWLVPIHPVLVAVPLAAFAMASGLLPALGGQLLRRALGRRSLRSLLFAWELAVPLAALAVLLVVTLPPRLFVLITNTTPERVPLGGGASAPPASEKRLAWASSLDTAILAPRFCQCGDTHCTGCDRRATKNLVRHVALGCAGDGCDVETEFVDGRSTARIVRSIGAERLPIRFSPRATAPHMTLTANGPTAIEAGRGIVVNAIDIPARNAVWELPMLPALEGYRLEFHGIGELRCDLPARRVVRLDLAPATRRAGEPPEPRASFEIRHGETRSTWTGALDEARACTGEAEPGPPVIELDTPAGALSCSGGPNERVLAVELPAPPALHDPPASSVSPAMMSGAPAASVEGWRMARRARRDAPAARSLSPLDRPLAHACLRRGGDLEFDGLAQGRPVALPKDLAFSRLWIAGATTGSPVEPCKPGDTVRRVKLAVPAQLRSVLKALRINRLDRTTGVTCATQGTTVKEAGYQCEFNDDTVNCTELPRQPGAQPAIACVLETNGTYRPQSRDDHCRVPLDDASRAQLAADIYVGDRQCGRIFKCRR